MLYGVAKICSVICGYPEMSGLRLTITMVLHDQTLNLILQAHSFEFLSSWQTAEKPFNLRDIFVFTWRDSKAVNQIPVLGLALFMSTLGSLIERYCKVLRDNSKHLISVDASVDPSHHVVLNRAQCSGVK